MGKGDKKSKRGKIFRGTYGKRRPRKAKSITHVSAVKDEQKRNEKKTDIVRPEEVKTEKKITVPSKIEKVKTEKKENEKEIDVLKPKEVKTEKKTVKSSKTEKVKTEKKKTTKKKSTKKETNKNK